MREETVKDLRPCLSLSSKIVFPKNMATAKRRAVFKSHWRGMAIKGLPETDLSFCKFQTELCVTSSTLDSFESEGF